MTSPRVYICSDQIKSILTQEMLKPRLLAFFMSKAKMVHNLGLYFGSSIGSISTCKAKLNSKTALLLLQRARTPQGTKRKSSSLLLHLRISVGPHKLITYQKVVPSLLPFLYPQMQSVHVPLASGRLPCRSFRMTCNW